MRGRLARLTEVALAAALLAVVSPVTLPLGPVPLSLATLAIYLIGGLFRPLFAVTSVAVYLMLGIAGLPIFAGFGGGVAVLVGPTGGFLPGYLLCVAATSLLTGLSRGRGRAARTLLPCLGMLLGTLALYLLGTLWYARLGGVGFFAALAVCALPFLLFDLMKIALALLLLPRLSAAVLNKGKQRY